MSHPLVNQAGANLAGLLSVALARGEEIDAETLEMIEGVATELESRGDVDSALPSLLRSLIARASASFAQVEEPPGSIGS